MRPLNAFLLLLAVSLGLLLLLTAYQFSRISERMIDLSDRLAALENTPQQFVDAPNKHQEPANNVNGSMDVVDVALSSEAANPGKALEQQPEEARTERMLDQLALHGFSAYESARVREIELAALAEYDELRLQNHASVQQELSQLMRNTMALVRTEVGDFAYEAYLRSKGLATSVEVKSVANNSQGKLFGLKVGDQIERYNGERVYDVLDLNRLVFGGSTPSSKNIELVFSREGTQIRRQIKAGAIGIHALPVTHQQFFNAYQ